MKNPLNDRDVDGNTMAWMADIDRNIESLCSKCECQVTEEQELCDKCKALEIGE